MAIWANKKPSTPMVNLFSTTLGYWFGKRLVDRASDINETSLKPRHQCRFAMTLISQVGLGAAKAAVLFLYLQFFSVKRWFRITVYVMLGITAAWTITFFLTNLLGCLPINPIANPLTQHCINTIPMWTAAAASDFVIDVIILVLPVPIVLGLQLPLRMRLATCGMFALGAA